MLFSAALWKCSRACHVADCVHVCGALVCIRLILQSFCACTLLCLFVSVSQTLCMCVALLCASVSYCRHCVHLLCCACSCLCKACQVSCVCACPVFVSYVFCVCLHFACSMILLCSDLSFSAGVWLIQVLLCVLFRLLGAMSSFAPCASAVPPEDCAAWFARLVPGSSTPRADMSFGELCSLADALQAQRCNLDGELRRLRWVQAWLHRFCSYRALASHRRKATANRASSHD